MKNNHKLDLNDPKYRGDYCSITDLINEIKDELYYDNDLTDIIKEGLKLTISRIKEIKKNKTR